jgi:hypothetical protein
MNKTALLSSGAALVLSLGMPCMAASLTTTAPTAQTVALPTVTTASSALPVLPAVTSSAAAGAGLTRVASSNQSLPGLDGLDSGAKPAAGTNISIRPIRVPPGIALPISLP